MNFLLGLASFKARLGIGAAIVAAVLGLRMWDISTQRAIGESKAVAKMERAADANAKKADAVRRSVERTADDRLFDRYRRD